jgi:hypothetical protein
MSNVIALHPPDTRRYTTHWSTVYPCGAAESESVPLRLYSKPWRTSRPGESDSTESSRSNA